MKRRLDKNGNPRKGNKPTITATRYRLRSMVWLPLKQALQYHLMLQPQGEAARIAKALGISNSQIHRFTCNKCDHDQEPSFTIGFALFVYLTQFQLYPIIPIPKPKRKRKSIKSK